MNIISALWQLVKKTKEHLGILDEDVIPFRKKTTFFKHLFKTKNIRAVNDVSHS